MNVEEGFRRISVILGVLGFVAGTFFAYSDIGTLSKTRAAHERFLSAMTWPVIQQVAKQAAADFKRGHEPIWYQIDREGVSNVMVSGGRIWAINLRSGEAILDQKVATTLDYASLCLFPLFGFLLPWGTVRVISWVISGFRSRAPIV